jgi:hypothetical protein
MVGGSKMVRDRAAGLVSWPRDPGEKLGTARLRWSSRDSKTRHCKHKLWAASPAQPNKTGATCQIPAHRSAEPPCSAGPSAPWPRRPPAPDSHTWDPLPRPRGTPTPRPCRPQAPDPHMRDTHPSAMQDTHPSATRDPHPSAMPASGPRPAHAGPSSLGSAAGSTTTRIPATSPPRTPAGFGPTARPDTCPSPAHGPSGPAEPQPRVGWPDPHPPIRPCPAPAQCGWLAQPAGTGTILLRHSRTHQPARNPAPCAELPRSKASQMTAPPGPRSAACLRDTHTGLDTKELKTTKTAILLFQNWWFFFFLPSLRVWQPG